MNRILFVLVILLGLTNSIGFGQNNYWSQQFGSRSSLMGGAVVGGVQDNSALYYNPAGIAYIDSAHLNVSANAYGMDIMSLKNGAGKDIDLNSLKILVYPQFISGLIKFKLAPKLKLSYGLLTRYRNEVKMHADNTIENTPILPMSIDSQYYYGSFDYELSYISQWGGFAAGYKFTDFFSMGLTTFVTYTHYDGFRKTFCTADFDHPNPDSIYTAKLFSYEYNNVDHFGMLWKLGFQFNWPKFKLGFTITSPNISLFGFTRIGRTLEFNNQNRFLPDSLAIGRNSSWLAADDKNNLQTTMKSPLSLAVGMEYDFPKTNTKITGTVEYFFPVQPYQIAKSNDPVYIRPIDSYNNAVYNSPFMEINARQSAVMNFAFGLEQRLGGKTTLYFGMRTDWNNGVEAGNNKAIISTYLNQNYNHYFHFSGGVTYKKGSSDISFGLNYGLGATSLKRQPINLSDPQVVVNDQGDYLILQGQQDESIRANVHSISLIIGYKYYLKR